MAITLRASFQGLNEVRRDLESVRLGLGRELNDAIREELGPLTAAVAQKTPLGPGPRPSRDEDSDDRLAHVRDTIVARPAGNGIVVESTHPAAGWLNFGGTISPRGVPITIRGYAMGEKGGEEAIPRIERAIDERIAQLAQQHNLT